MGDLLTSSLYVSPSSEVVGTARLSSTYHTQLHVSIIQCYSGIMRKTHGLSVPRPTGGDARSRGQLNLESRGGSLLCDDSLEVLRESQLGDAVRLE